MKSCELIIAMELGVPSLEGQGWVAEICTKSKIIIFSSSLQFKSYNHKMKRKIIPYNPKLKELARTLRHSMTYAEVKLWNKLKNFQMMGYDFDRQRPILNFIVDFYCKDLLLAIEVDGITHHDELVTMKDEIRDEELNMHGVHVLRFKALDVVGNINNILRLIETWILDFENKNGVMEHVVKRRAKP